MKEKKTYEPPMVIDLQVDYTQAVGQSRCNAGPTATGQCTTGPQANRTCGTGTQFTPFCGNGQTANGCNTGKTP